MLEGVHGFGIIIILCTFLIVWTVHQMFHSHLKKITFETEV